MVSLKKNDKIVIIIGVLVLVIAGVGIAVYVPPEKTNNEHTPPGETTYQVAWQTSSGTYQLNDELYTSKNKPYSKEITLTQDNLLEVTIELSWTDDHTYGLLRKKGLDTLTVDVTGKGQTKTEKQTGNGTMTLTFRMNTLPTITTIQASTLSDAEDAIKADYYKTADETFTINVKVQTGEKIFRFFKYLRDKGNDFDVKITYTYFNALISETKEETKNTHQNTYNTDDTWEPPYLSMILKTGCSRYI
ncbi:MAG: hypothetical protein QXL17_01350 [Candidatus Thermoplasmatota archaeon]